MSDVITLLISLFKLALMISIGVFIGTIFERINLQNRLAFILKPLSKFTGLSSLGCTAFVTAFASPRAANTILASSCDEGLISKREMILSALANSTAAVFVHLRVSSFVLLPLLGKVGLAYIGVQIIGAFITTILALLILNKNSSVCDINKDIKLTPTNKKHKTLWQVFFKRNKTILLRVLIITVPLYSIIYFLNINGYLALTTSILPDNLKSILRPESMVIIGVHFSGIMPAVSAASLALRDGVLSQTQVFITLLVGYIFTTPVRAIRHTLPSALGIFPGKTGLYIVTISQIIKIIVAIIAILITLKVAV